MIKPGIYFEKLRTFHLLIILAALYGLLGVYQIIPLRPQSVHQWAQCDRASVAWNYYVNHADFFHPQVNNTDNGTGVTGLEFPIVQYFVSILYRLFGFHEWLYRLVTLIVFTIGATSVFRLSDYFVKNKLHALLIMLLYVCSPLLTFYSCSFLPDIYSLSFAMMSWSALVSFAKTREDRFKWLWWLAMTVSFLIKPNSMIHLPAMGLFLYQNKLWTRQTGLKYFSFFAIAVISTFCWYAYASWLSKSTQSEVFLLEMRPPKSWQEMKDVWEIVSKDWIERIYHPVILSIILIAGVISILLSNPLKGGLSAYVLLMMAGGTAFLYVMLLQLSYHDYYFITMFPLVLFLLFIIRDTFHSKMNANGHAVFTICVLMAVGFQFYFSKTHLRTSHKKDNWKYGSTANDIYFSPDLILKAGNIKLNDQVVVVFDHSPNISLYLMGLKGVTIPYRKVQETLMGYLHTGRYNFVIFNKKSQIEGVTFNAKDFPLDYLGEANEVQIFKVSSSFQPDGNQEPLSPWN